MKKLILHIPHSATDLPTEEGFIISEEKIKNEILKLTDWYTDDLFYSETDEMVIADFSRIFCDPERFTDDKQEIMSEYGMGVLYEKNDDGEVIRKVNPELKERVLKNYYWKHHGKFSDKVKNQLRLFGKALIIDCHSYPSIPLNRDLDKNVKRPDFNIGTDTFHTPKHLVDLSIEFFKDAGFSLGIDWPYKGSIVPLEYYQKNRNVQSIMLEINRALYLKEPTNEKSENYEQTKKVVNEFISAIKNSL